MGTDIKNTKQNILDTALKLFSKRGYSAVSIRDIGNIVGIKESTIYYHFKNKQDIFDELLKRFEKITNEKPIKFSKEFNKITKVEKEAFIQVGLGILKNYFLETEILQFIRMLMIEQHVNKAAADLYEQVIFEIPLKHNVSVFDALMKMNCFKNDDSNYMALEYYSPILFIFQRYFSSGEVTEDKLEIAEHELRIYLANFYDKYNIS
ncbi:MAG: TetR family transcriptional regulator [Bacillota bacterium]|nr:TetR family transcriptional regulator [Bacillota bacterium]